MALAWNDAVSCHGVIRSHHDPAMIEVVEE
jgi:hypothetical protein